MSKELENNLNQDNILEFDEATQMTIKDALDKEADLQAGVTDQDSILDKYIKKHQDEVGEQKFLNKVGTLDTEALDDFIQKQKAELADRKAELLAGAATTTAAASQAGQKTVEAATEKVAPAATAVTTAAAASQAKTSSVSNQDHLLDDSSVLDEKPAKKNKFLVAGALGALFLAIAGAGYGLTHFNQAANQANNKTATTASSTSSSSKSTTSSSEKESESLKKFNDLYANFFADDKLTKPKNSEFDKLGDLEEALKALEGTDDYEEAKSKFDSLSKTISAIQAINDKFETPAIVDGEKVEATLKEGATFDDLSSDVLNTGKASMDTLIQAIVAEGRGLVENGGGTLSGGTSSTTDTDGTSETAAETIVDTNAEANSTTDTGAGITTDNSEVTTSAPTQAGETGVTSGTEATSQQAEGTAVGSGETAAVANVDTVTSTQDTATAVTPNAEASVNTPPIIAAANLPAGHIQSPTNYGLVSYDPSTLQRDLSRVPFNFDLIADTSNPAWTFNPGVMEEIIRVSQERGYINGYEFILEPVNIVNGNGYYNMYKPDGTYLFSINAKTGYFVGNGRGYADDLDY